MGALVRWSSISAACFMLGFVVFGHPPGPRGCLQERGPAKRLADSILIADTHIDLPSRLMKGWEDLTVRSSHGQFDYVRAREGGLDLAFMAIYVPSRLEGTVEAARHADAQIALVRKMADTWPDAFVVVTSTAEVERERGKGRVMLAMGMENGAPLNGDLAAVLKSDHK